MSGGRGDYVNCTIIAYVLRKVNITGVNWRFADKGMFPTVSRKLVTSVFSFWEGRSLYLNAAPSQLISYILNLMKPAVIYGVST